MIQRFKPVNYQQNSMAVINYLGPLQTGTVKLEQRIILVVEFYVSAGFCWYNRVDSNHRPPPCQGGALTN